MIGADSCLPRELTVDVFSGGEKGVPRGACGLLSAMGKIELMPLIESAACLQYRARTGAGITLKGIYGDINFFVFHIMYRTEGKRKELEEWFLRYGLHLLDREEMVKRKFYYEYDMPRMVKYIVSPPTREEMLELARHDDQDRFVTERVSEFNTLFKDDARIFSSGKRAGTFLTAFELSDTIKIFEIDKYADDDIIALQAHVRWPTSTGRGLWWGPQPIALYNVSGIHNGHLSSDRANSRALEQLGIRMQVGTDSEAIFLEISHLISQGYSLRHMEWIMAQKFPGEVELLEEEERKWYLALTRDPLYSQFKMSGPSTAMVLVDDILVGITDRDHLRPFSVGEGKDLVIMASEERAILSGAYLLGKEIDLYTPEAGKIVGYRIVDGKVERLDYSWKRAA
jgi:glutamate synthase domain-containing protein 1